MEHPWWMALLPVGAGLTRLLGRTLRCTFINYETEQKLRRAGEPILAFWHRQLFFFVYYYRDQAIPVMMSRSADGEILARVADTLGFFPVRGSSSRSGMVAFREVVRLLKEGRGTGFAPDGPRGPRCRVQPGIIELARASGRPILPACFAARHRVVFNSWDRFVLPLPFSR
ncbi:MAG: lysophospholipid acyltransferase family protein, partial [Candidatus Tectimicrobiota bacterium]